MLWIVIYVRTVWVSIVYIPVIVALGLSIVVTHVYVWSAIIIMGKRTLLHAVLRIILLDATVRIISSIHVLRQKNQ